MFKKLFSGKNPNHDDKANRRGASVTPKPQSQEPEMTPELEASLADEYYPDSPPLLSACGADYRLLRSYLAQEQWKRADQETARLLLSVAKQTQKGWLSREDLVNFPCEDLGTIDRLWVHYSQGQFGFSAPEEDYEAYKKFAELVGWRKKGEWLFYDKLIFNVDRSPFGHLPSFRRAGAREMIFFRILTCRLFKPQH
jgi:hypothetical protein